MTLYYLLSNNHNEESEFSMHAFLDAPMINWWDNGLDQIAFARSGKGFIAINNDDFPLIATLNVNLYFHRS